jgi:hypothetical protein
MGGGADVAEPWPVTVHDPKSKKRAQKRDSKVVSSLRKRHR